VLRKYFVNMSFSGLYSGLYGRNLPYTLKKSYVDFQNRNFENLYTAVGLLVPGQI
jgi:hypothetical protein